MWDSEMIILLRHVIDDVDTPVKYTDERLMQLLLVGAQFVQKENTFPQAYTISLENFTLKPDPTATATRDDGFVNLTILKSACLLASGGLLKASKGGMWKEGPYQVDTRGKIDGRKVVTQTWCDAYKDAQWENSINSRDAGRAIIGPYRAYINRYNTNCSLRYLHNNGGVPDF